MALLGILASLSFLDGETTVSGVGIKDLNWPISVNVIEIESRGYDWKRVLRGQKDIPVTFNVEADAPCVALLRRKFYANDANGNANLPATFTDANGDTFDAVFVVTKFEGQNPVGGEAEYSVELRLSATASLEEQPTYEAAA